MSLPIYLAPFKTISMIYTASTFIDTIKLHSDESLKAAITITIPVYNGENFIREAINSIFRQSFNNFLLIISDNASNDGTSDIVQEYCQSDPRIIHIRHNENIGMLANGNFCMSIIRELHNKYFFILSHDDCLASDSAIQTAYHIMEQQPEISAVYCDLLYISNGGSVIGKRRFSRVGCIEAELLAKNSIITTRNMFGIALLMRTQALRNQNISYNLQFSYIADVEFSYLISAHGSIYHIPEFFIANRFHGKNSTRGIIKKAKRQFLQFAATYNFPLTRWELLQQHIWSRFVVLQKSIFFLFIDFRNLWSLFSRKIHEYKRHAS